MIAEGQEFDVSRLGRDQEFNGVENPDSVVFEVAVNLQAASRTSGGYQVGLRLHDGLDLVSGDARSHFRVFQLKVPPPPQQTSAPSISTSSIPGMRWGKWPPR